MKITFIAAGPPLFASSRIRCYWPAPHIDGAQVTNWDEIGKQQQIPIADVYVFQKKAEGDFMRQVKETGGKIVYDICDPVHWFSPDEARSILPYIDAVTAATLPLARDWHDWCGIMPTVIRDRIKREHYPKQRQHQDRKPVRLIWYGIGFNRVSLASAWANLARAAANGHQIELTLFDDWTDKPLGYGDEVPVYRLPWRLARENDVLAAHDIAILPPYPGPWGRLKSDNKHQTAWASGLPVTTGGDYQTLVNLITDPQLREMSAASGLETMRETEAETAREFVAVCEAVCASS